MTRRRLPVIRLPLFKRGAEVQYNDRTYIVDYVTVTTYQMLVHLVGESKPVPSEHLKIEWSEIDFEEIRKKYYEGS